MKKILRSALSGGTVPRAIAARIRLLSAAVLVALPAIAQETARPLPPSVATSVLVDVVVRDGKGRPVTDLRAEEFDVLEDGTPQKVQEFALVGRPVAGAAAAAVATPEEAASGAGLGSSVPPEHATLALVFDRLSTEGRLAAWKAAVDFLDHGYRLGDRVGVFSIEGTLVVLQDFTSDPALLRAAVDALSGRVAHTGATPVEAARAGTAARIQANGAMETYLRLPQPSDAGSAVAKAQAGIVAKNLSMAQAVADVFERLQRDEQGFATAHALTAIIDAIGGIKGRKAVVLFSDGLFRTEATETRFLSVINSANRGSVSVYAVGAAGLEVKTLESLTAAEMKSTGNLLREQSMVDDSGGGARLRSLERNEDLVRFNPRASLEWLSDATGGFFVRDTNDLSGALERVDGDLRSYYLLGYTPSNETYDGRFRKIRVKVRRPGVDVRARSGYFAVRSVGPVLAHVAPALALLEGGKRPHVFDLFARALPFPESEGATRVAITALIPAKELARLASRHKGDRLDVTILARVLRADGKAADVLSRRIVVDTSSRRAQGADVRFLRDAWLPPGRYKLQVAAYEAGSGDASVVADDLEVGGGSRPLDCAQIVIVREVVKAADGPSDLEVGHPLRLGEVLLLPAAGESFSRRAGRPLVFQLTMPPTAGRLPPNASVEIWKQGERVGQAAAAWSPVDGSGLLRHVAELPVASYPPGSYEIRVDVSDGKDSRVLSAGFGVSE